MFATILRNQARTALVLSRARLPVTSLLLSNRPLPIPRPLPNAKPQGLPRWYSTELEREDSPGTPRSQHATVWVGNLPFSADDTDVREKFSEFGQVKQVRLGRTNQGVSRGFAHVDFASSEDAARAVEACEGGPIRMHGRVLRVDLAPDDVLAINNPPHYKLYIREFDGDERTLREIFQAFEKQIVRVSIMRNRDTGEPTRVGFVDFVNIPSATKAKQALHGTEVAPGVRLHVSFARKQVGNTSRQDGQSAEGSGRVAFSGSRGRSRRGSSDTNNRSYGEGREGRRGESDGR